MTAKQPGGTKDPGGTKNMVLRLDPDLAARLQTVAEVEGRSVSDVVREAIADLVERRRNDQRFIRLLEENLARHERALNALRDDLRDDGS
jgi:predicted transcriptional regulator